jgi:hypothetical protein
MGGKPRGRLCSGKLGTGSFTNTGRASHQACPLGMGPTSWGLPAKTPLEKRTPRWSKHLAVQDDSRAHRLLAVPCRPTACAEIVDRDIEGRCHENEQATAAKPPYRQFRGLKTAVVVETSHTGENWHLRISPIVLVRSDMPESIEPAP